MIKSTESSMLTSVSILFMGILIGFTLIMTGALSAEASSIDDIVFPIAELGSCGDKSECKSYCDDIDHADECIAFAEEHNLMNDRELKDAKEYVNKGIRSGPGNCTTHGECENYCEDTANIDECLAFAEDHDIIPKEELKEARKIAKALHDGAQLPGGCTSKQSCETYCEEGAHIEECVAFAEKAGFMDEREIEEMKKILPLMKSGQMPGGCTSKQSCEAYCEDDSHINECVAFAEKAGFMSKAEAEMVRKTGGRGPGGCVRDECEAYCENPDNEEACFAFAKEHGLVSDEDLSHMKEGSSRIREGLEHANPKVITCLKDEVGPHVIDEIENGTFSPSRNSGEAIKGCFEQHMEQPNFRPEGEHMDDFDGEHRGEDFERDHGDDLDKRRIEAKFESFIKDGGDPEEFKRKFDEERDRFDQDFQGRFEDGHDDGDFRKREIEAHSGNFDEDIRRKEEFMRKFEEEKNRIEHDIRTDAIRKTEEIEENRIREAEKLHQFESFNSPPPPHIVPSPEDLERLEQFKQDGQIF